MGTRRDPDAVVLPPPDKNARAELLRYRGYVAQIASRAPWSPKDEDALAAIRDFLEIPEWSMRRDVRAVLRWQNATRSQRVELLFLHPHLFDDPTSWVRGFMERRARRRRVTPQPEASTAAGSL